MIAPFFQQAYSSYPILLCAHRDCTAGAANMHTLCVKHMEAVAAMARAVATSTLSGNAIIPGSAPPLLSPSTKSFAASTPLLTPSLIKKEFFGFGEGSAVPAPLPTPSLIKKAPKRVNGSRSMCKIEGCKSMRVARGLCCGHGANGVCSQTGCTTFAKARGLCGRHGGRIKVACKYVDGCTTAAVGKGLCAKHGGNGICKISGCGKNAKARLLCSTHCGRAAKERTKLTSSTKKRAKKQRSSATTGAGSGSMSSSTATKSKRAPAASSSTTPTGAITISTGTIINHPSSEKNVIADAGASLQLLTHYHYHGHQLQQQQASQQAHVDVLHTYQDAYLEGRVGQLARVQVVHEHLYANGGYQFSQSV